MADNKQDLEWQVQKLCTDVENYELIIEKQKTGWECEQKKDAWKWGISYHGSLVASGAVHSLEEAKKHAALNIPL